MHSQGAQAAALTLLLAATLSSQVPAGVERFSTDKERVLGERYAEEILRQWPAIENEVAQRYVDLLGARLLAHVPKPLFSYTFKLVSAPDAKEAIFAPGYVLVPGELLLTVRSEDEAAAVLAHAIAHVESRHGTRSATGARTGIVASIPLVYVYSGPSSLVPVSMLSATRQYELEADEYGARLCAAADYEPQAWAALLERTNTPPAKPEFAPLPVLELRLKAVRSVERPSAAREPVGDLAAVQQSLKPSRRRPTLAP